MKDYLASSDGSALIYKIIRKST